MVKIDLITGFLGAGKTTFIRKYARHLIEDGQNICILENDYGAVNVDMMMLRALEGPRCSLEMVSGGCDPDCHRRRFKTKLIAMGMCGYDRVLVEPSGIFDMDEFFDALREEPLDRWYEIGSVISIVDACLDPLLSPSAEYYLASEAASAGVILMSRSQQAASGQVDATIAHLNRALELAGCHRQVGPEVISKDWEELSADDLFAISQAGYRREDFPKPALEPGNEYGTLYFMNAAVTQKAMEAAVPCIFNDSKCGFVYRIKGFFASQDGNWLELNATPHGMEVRTIETGQPVIIVIGERLNRQIIERHFTL